METFDRIKSFRGEFEEHRKQLTKPPKAMKTPGGLDTIFAEILVTVLRASIWSMKRPR